MPISKYYQGHGSEVMSDMMKRYGEEKGKSVFYATANKRGQNPEDSKVKKSMKHVMRPRKKAR
jgi:hypothetical protein